MVDAKTIIMLTEKFLKQREQRVCNADPTGYDVVIKDLNKRIHLLTAEIRRLQKLSQNNYNVAKEAMRLGLSNTNKIK